MAQSRGGIGRRRWVVAAGGHIGSIVEEAEVVTSMTIQFCVDFVSYPRHSLKCKTSQFLCLFYKIISDCVDICDPVKLLRIPSTKI